MCRLSYPSDHCEVFFFSFFLSGIPLTLERLTLPPILQGKVNCEHLDFLFDHLRTKSMSSLAGKGSLCKTAKVQPRRSHTRIIQTCARREVITAFKVLMSKANHQDRLKWHPPEVVKSISNQTNLTQGHLTQGQTRHDPILDQTQTNNRNPGSNFHKPLPN